MEIRSDGGYRLTGVRLAVTFRERLRGLMGRRPGPLLLPTSSVHGFWLHEDVLVVGVTATGTVAAVRRLRRRRVITVPGARWIIELPLAVPAPKSGERLAIFQAISEP